MVMTLKEKQALLKNIVKKTQEKNGGAKHVLAFAGDRVEEMKHQFIPTPSENINMALGNGSDPGGFVRGRISEVAGESSSGKTSLMLETIGKDHQNDPESMWGWLDTEGDWDADYAIQKGIDLSRLVLWEVDDSGAEVGLDTLEMMIRSNAMKGIVINSVTGLTPSSELDSEMGKQSIALQARLMSKLMRKIIAISNRTNTAVIFINQLRTDVGSMFGDPNVTTGGKALQYFASQRITLRKVKLQKEDGITIDEGIKVNVRVSKNRIARDNPYKATSYTALYGYGIDDVREVAQIAIETNTVDKRGSWTYYPTKENVAEWNGQKLAFNGQGAFIDFIRDNPTFKEHLKNMLHGQAVVGTLPAEEIAAIEAEEQALAAELGSEFGDTEPEAVAVSEE